MQLDEQIRDALASEARAIPAEAIERLRRIDYRPRRRSTPALLGAGVTGGAAALAGTLVALGGTGTQAAFAGWSATPTTPSASQTGAVEAACAARMAEAVRNAEAEAARNTDGSSEGVKKSGASVGSEPLLADTRGPYTLVLYPWGTCFAGPDFMSLSGRRGTEGVSISTAYRDGGPYTIAQGPAAPDASAVTLTLDDGSSVEATVVDSSFLAWWPSTSRPTSETITTPSGTHTEPLSFPPAPTPPASKQTPAQR
jgi:hypothetical protein